MPTPYERHARTKEHWDTAPQRSQQRAAAVNDGDGTKRSPRKKDPAACKANHWGPHEPHIVKIPNSKACSWRSNYGWRSQEYAPVWSCHHREECKHCGKQFRQGYSLDNSECPEFIPDVPASVYTEMQEWIARRARWEAQRAARKARTAPDGPQSYRKKKSAGKGNSR